MENLCSVIEGRLIDVTIYSKDYLEVFISTDLSRNECPLLVSVLIPFNGESLLNYLMFASFGDHYIFCDSTLVVEKGVPKFIASNNMLCMS